MPRKFLKRIMPDHASLRDNPYLGRFGQRLFDPLLWHLNRKQVSIGAAVGLFLAALPIPMQMFIVALLAMWWRFNLPMAILCVWVTNPLTMGPIFYFQYRLGAWILDVPVANYAFEMSWRWFSNVFAHIWQPFLLGAVITGIIAAILGVIIVRVLWRIAVVYSWVKRRKRQRQNSLTN